MFQLRAKDLTQKWLVSLTRVSLPTTSRMCRKESGYVSLMTLEKLTLAPTGAPNELIIREKKGPR